MMCVIIVLPWCLWKRKRINAHVSLVMRTYRSFKLNSWFRNTNHIVTVSSITFSRPSTAQH